MKSEINFSSHPMSTPYPMHEEFFKLMNSIDNMCQQ